MSERSVLQRIEWLRGEIRRHDELYFREIQRGGEPEISDFEYDAIKKELRDLEAAHPKTSSSDSPTQAVGDDRIEGFATYPHRTPMLSLDNTYNEEELGEFENRLQRILNLKVLEYTVEPKIDGVAVNVTYEKGLLVRAVTRGNGTEGDDVTRNVSRIDGLPHHLGGTNHPDIIELRGEIYMTLEEFERINAEQAATGLQLFKNPRNFAAGTLKLLDVEVATRRKLDIVLYGLGYCEPPRFRTQTEIQETLADWGVPRLRQFWAATGIGEAWKHIEILDRARMEFDYATDGAVVKLHAIDLQDAVGATAKAPRWAIAYKFAAERVETQLHAITIQVGRTGTLTPVAELHPVQLAGTTVSRATLHNSDEISRKDIREGDAVVIEKAGEIIPAVVKVKLDDRDPGSRPYIFPTHCPACGTEATRLLDEVIWRCPNLSCPPQMRQRIIHFASREAMDIEGLGIKVVNNLMDRELVKTAPDLYGLTPDDLIPLKNFRERSAHNLIEALKRSKTNDLWRLLHGLGIQNVGVNSSKDIARNLGSLSAVMEADTSELTKIDGIGEIMAQSIQQFFAEESNHSFVERLVAHGLRTSAITSDRTTLEHLQGQSFVITGTLPTLKRDQAKALIEESGGRVAGSVSAKTDFLVAGDSAGSKLRMARSLEVKVIDEVTLLEMLRPAQ